jgi:hypothetical protein
MSEVVIFGGGRLYGYLITPAGILPVGEEIGTSIQLRNWNPPQFAMCQRSHNGAITQRVYSKHKRR